MKTPYMEPLGYKSSLLEAELVERCNLAHFLPEKLYFGYSRGLSLLAHLCLLPGNLLGTGRILWGQFCGHAVQAAQIRSEWGVCPPWAVPV